MVSIKSETVSDTVGNILMRVRLEAEDGTVTEKTLSMEKYLKILGENSLAVDMEYYRVGAMPDNYYGCCIAPNKQFTAKVVFCYKAKKRGFLYAGQHFYIPFPALAFYYHVKDGIIAQKECYALSTDQFSDDTKLMNYPFGNVDCSGSICYGNISLKKIKEMTDLEDVVDDFFMSETNNDLYSTTNNNTNYTQSKLVEKLSKMDKFPCEWLTKSNSNKKTLGELLDKKKN